MNDERRKTITSALNKIREAMSELETAWSDEQEYYDNMPESLQGSEKGERAEEVANLLREAIDEIENQYSAIEDAAS